MKFTEVARIAHEQLRLFQFLTSGPGESVDPVVNLDAERLFVLYYDTQCILDAPEKTPEEWHQIRTAEDLKRGWKWGYLFDPEKMEDPLCADWVDCPPAYQAAKIFFWATVVGIGIETGFITGKELEAYQKSVSEGQAEVEAREVAESITYPNGGE
jgi:hypothetical protein